MDFWFLFPGPSWHFGNLKKTSLIYIFLSWLSSQVSFVFRFLFLFMCIISSSYLLFYVFIIVSCWCFALFISVILFFFWLVDYGSASYLHCSSSLYFKLIYHIILLSKTADIQVKLRLYVKNICKNELKIMWQIIHDNLWEK